MRSISFNIHLNEDTLSQGTRLDDRKCPIQAQIRAALDTLGLYPEEKYVTRVSETFFGVIRKGNNRYTAKVPLPKQVQSFIALFDQHKDEMLKPLLPLNFSLEIPIRD